jgi:hypothetical protein
MAALIFLLIFFYPSSDGKRLARNACEDYVSFRNIHSQRVFAFDIFAFVYRFECFNGFLAQVGSQNAFIVWQNSFRSK